MLLEVPPPFKNCLLWRWGEHLVGSLEFSNGDVWKERCEQWQGSHLGMSREPWRDEVMRLCCSCFDSCVAWACVRKQAVILIEVHSFSDKWLWVLRLARTWAAEGASLMVLRKKLLAFSLHLIPASLSEDDWAFWMWILLLLFVFYVSVSFTSW